MNKSYTKKGDIKEYNIQVDDIKEFNKQEVLLRIENIAQNLKVIESIFDSMKTYWIGESADTVRELYGFMEEEICMSNEFLDDIARKLGADSIRKLPGDIF